MMLPCSILLAQIGAADTLVVSALRSPPLVREAIAGELGDPQARILTRQGAASVWLGRFQDTVYLLAVIPDSTPYWGDDFVISIDTRGDAAADPQHDDFQLAFRRHLDSSVVFRGRNRRWAYPRDDPDWRLGPERIGGGWSVDAREDQTGWVLLLKLDRAWFEGEHGRLPRLAFRIYDDSPAGWFAWPEHQGIAQSTIVEMTPSMWAPVRRLTD